MFQSAVCLFQSAVFIQPLVRTVFKRIFSRDITTGEQRAQEAGAGGEKLCTGDETKTIADAAVRMDEIKKDHI
jgi:hypothetical protein